MDPGPFFHGTKADLRVGDMLTAGFDKKFPGNPTRSYRSRHPLRIVGEVTAWESFDAEFVQDLRRKVLDGMGEIIN